MNGGLEIRYSRVGVGAIKGGIIGKVKEDGLHLPPHHTLNPVAGLSERSACSGEVKPSHIESVADKVLGPLVRGRIGVAEVKNLLVIGGVFYDADSCLAGEFTGMMFVVPLASAGTLSSRWRRLEPSALRRSLSSRCTA